MNDQFSSNSGFQAKLEESEMTNLLNDMNEFNEFYNNQSSKNDR